MSESNSKASKSIFYLSREKCRSRRRCCNSSTFDVGYATDIFGCKGTLTCPISIQNELQINKVFIKFEIAICLPHKASNV